MRQFIAAFLFLGLIGASLLWPRDPAPAAATSTLIGHVFLHGYPIEATIEIRADPDDAPESGDLHHSFGGLPRFREHFGPPIPSAPPLQVTSTAQDGSFRFEGLRDGRYHLAVRIPDGTEAESTAEVQALGEIAYECVEVGTSRRTVVAHATGDAPPVREGRVLEDHSENPVAGAFVLARSVRPGAIRANRKGTVTGEDGRYRIAVAAGDTVWIVADGFLPIEFEVPADETLPRIRLLRRPVVTGVVRHRGRPVPGVPVTLTQLERRPFEAMPMPARARVTTDREGRFRIEAPMTGDVMAAVCGGGWMSSRLTEASVGGYNPLAFTLEPGQRVAVDLEVVRSPSIQGRVTDERGRPVAGALIWVSEGESDYGEYLWRVGWALDHIAAATDADGRYVIPTVFPGVPWGAMASTWDRDWAVSEPKPAVPGETAVIDLTLEPPRTRWIETRVVDAADGQPIAGAEVRVSAPPDASKRAWDPFGEGFNDRGTTGPDGRVRIGPVPDRPLTMRVRHDRYLPTDEAPFADEITMTRGHVIAGKVLLPDGSPVREWWISVDGGESFMTDPDGTFRRQNLPEGEHALRARDLWVGQVRYTGSVLAETGCEDVVLRLAEDPPKDGPEPGPEITVRVRDAEGRPVPAGIVSVLPLLSVSDLIGYHDWSFENGVRRITISGDTEMLWIDARPFDRELGKTLAGPFSPDVGEVVITVPPARRIAGAVRSPTGAGIRGVRVFAIAENDSLLEREDHPDYHAAAYTDAEGRFVLPALGDGPYFLSAAVPGRFFLPEALRENAGSEDVEIRLHDAAMPVVRVVDGLDRPLVGAVVHAHRPGTRWRADWCAVSRARTDEDGEARLTGLDPLARYILCVDPPEGREDVVDREVRDWAPVDTKLPLVVVRRLTGVVRCRNGHPIARAKLWYRYRNEEDDWERVVAEDDGTFLLENLELTPIVIRAGTTRAEFRSEANVDHAVGLDEDHVEIEVDGGRWIAVRIPDWPEDAEGTADLSGSRPVPVPADGVVRFHGLPENQRFTFHAGVLPDGRMAFARNLEAGKEHVVALRPGKEIEVRLLLPSGYRQIRVHASGNGFTVEGEIVRPGHFRIRGLPDERCSIQARCEAEGKDYAAWADGSPGDTVALTLEPVSD